MSKTFYVTTPIYYPNGIPHVGTAYTTIAGDVLARWHRLRDGRAFLLTGTDEHGQKVEQAAKASQIPPEAYVNQIVEMFKEAWKRLHIRYDDFIRTTEARHVDTVSKIFQRLQKKGDIVPGHYEGWYCVSCETFWLENQLVEGNCPNPECRKAVEWLREEEYFFKLSAYQDRLLDYYESHPEFVQPQTRFNEVKSFVRGGLQDICVSRKGLRWGIPVPGDPERSIYVWIDALSNYITAIGYLQDSERFQTLWPVEFHLVAKDILRFHAVTWPAILMALDLPLPKIVFAHGWLTIGGSKISKSRGGHRNLIELLDEYGPDPLRYFLLRESAFGLDFDFSEEGIIRRLNTDLANDLGNLVHRVLSMLHRYFGGMVPNPGKIEPEDQRLKNSTEELPFELEALLDKLEFRGALQAIFDRVVLGNRYVDESAPWKLKKEGAEERLATVLYHLCELVRILALALSPFLPQSASLIWRQLGLLGSAEEEPYASFQWGGLTPGQRVEKPVPLFQKVEVPAHS